MPTPSASPEGGSERSGDSGPPASEGAPLLAIVAMGASAGGLEAYGTFFDHMPSSSGLAFVLIQHLDPDHASALPELLARRTAMPVEQVTDELPVKADHVYVIPPNATLAIEAGVLKLLTPLERRGQRAPIDRFFTSLAQDQGERAIAVVLSGSGSDGALGLRAVKDRGGLALAQAPESARHDTMPRRAIETGLVDEVLALEAMPERLLAYARHLATLRERAVAQPAATPEGDELGQICALVRRKTGHDFSHYKQGTLRRRIQRRMQVCHIESIGPYVERLRNDSNEIELLYNDLLIGVTEFFRAPESFEVLAREVIPKLFAGKGAHDEVRLWVPGCASGEEAYSLGILLCEHAARLDVAPRIRIFATDIDEQGLDVARRAHYPDGIAVQVSPGRLERFFLKTSVGYDVVQALREMCVFSPHNLLRDPPFSRIDLVSCRNVLIYLESDVQRKILPLFHYALRPAGYLFLGPSENVAVHSDLFQEVDRKHQIHQRKDLAVRTHVEFPLSEPAGLSRPAPQHPSVHRQTPKEPGVGRILERRLLEAYAPPSVVINEHGDIVYITGRTGKYLEPAQGVPRQNLFEMARQGLRIGLHSAIRQVADRREQVTLEHVAVRTNGETQVVDVIVRPMTEAGEDSSLIVLHFFDVQTSPSEPGIEPRAEPDSLATATVPESVIQRLEGELRLTKERLQTTVEDLEASNEELLSMNEELQSSNEELQTSKEELQSINEELQTVNVELRKKVEELDHSNSDLQNLFSSTSIATIFLDTELRIKRYTPAMEEIFHFIESDIGRPLTDFASRIENDMLPNDMREVLRTLTTRERLVRRPEDDRWFMMRIMPYRTVGNVIDGVVLTFVDVTELRRAEQVLREQKALEDSRAYLESIVATVREPLLILDSDLRVVSANRSFFETFAVAAQETTGRPLQELAGRAWDIPELLRRLRETSASATSFENFEIEHAFPTIGTRRMLASARRLRGNDRHDHLVLLAIEDATERLHAQDVLRVAEARRESDLRQQQIADCLPQLVWTARSSGEPDYYNQRWFEYTGMSGNPTDHQASAIHPDDRQNMVDAWRKAVDTCEPLEAECRLRRADGAYRWHLLRAVPMRSEAGRVERWFGTWTDIDEQKRAAAALREADRNKDEFFATLAHELRNPLAPIRNAVEIFRKVAPADPRLDRARDAVDRQVTHLTRLVDDLLDMSRIARGKLQLRHQRLDLVSLVHETARDIEPTIVNAGLLLQLALPSGPLWMQGDRTRLAQVVGNLLQNAVQFTDRGGVIHVELGKNDRTAVLAVRDTGIGMTSDMLEHAFDPLTSSRRFNHRSRTGLGLGLTVVKSIVELHGGTVRAESEGPGKGTSIVSTLPVEPIESDTTTQGEQPDHDCPAGHGSTGSAGGATHSAAAGRVLLVEDNADVAESTRDLLQLAGVEVLVAQSGTEALSKARSFAPDIVLCDIGLPPPMNGYDVARALRAQCDSPCPTLVAVSGYGRLEDKQAARDAGFDGHLTKPFTLDDLLRFVERARDRTER